MRRPPARAGALIALACALAVAMEWPLATNPSGAPWDSGDRMVQSWQIAWGGHALATDPAGIFDTNTYYPLDGDLAFMDALLGFAPAGLIGSGPEAAMIRYNLMALLSAALAFAGAAALARELGLSWPAALVAGGAFAYAPFRLTHYNHLNVISSGGIPLSLALLHRGYRLAAPGLVLAGWAVATWQVSVGFTLGLQLVYLLAVLAGVAAMWWLARGRPMPARPVVTATGAGVAVLAGWSAFQAAPYLQVLSAYPGAHRSQDLVAFYSPPPRALLAAPEQSALWGEVTEPIRSTLAWAPEMSLFPGVAVVVLALAGLASRRWPARYRLLLGAIAVGSGVLALGYSLPVGREIHDFLYRYLPGWQASRTPGRLFTITSLALALLAAAGAQSIGGRWADRRPGRGWIVVPVLALTLILMEGRPALPIEELNVDPAAVQTVDPQLHLPSDQHRDPYYVFLSTAGFPRMFNGHSSFVPDSYHQIRERMRGFPDTLSVRTLRALGIRTVVLHLDLVGGSPWEGAAGHSIQGLDLSREVSGRLVFYRVLDRSEPGTDA